MRIRFWLQCATSLSKAISAPSILDFLLAGSLRIIYDWLLEEDNVLSVESVTQLLILTQQAVLNVLKQNDISYFKYK